MPDIECARRVFHKLLLDSVQLHRNQRGQISLVVAVIALGLGIACCFVGGIAERVASKLEVQQAADAAAYSNALVSARGMNAVTATNHLMGELTALCILHEGLGALQVEQDDASPPTSFPESEEMSREIQDKKSAHYPSLTERGGETLPAAYIYNWDKKIVENCVEIIRLDSDGRMGHHQTGAALYDAMIRIKEQAGYTLTVKQVLKDVNVIANLVAKVPKLRPFMIVIDTVVAVAHAYGDVLLLDLAKEKIFLRGMDAIWPALGSFKQPVRSVLIPALSQYADSVVGVAGSDAQASGLYLSPVQRAQEAALSEYLEFYRIDRFGQHPAPKSFRLPLVPEPVKPVVDAAVIPPTIWDSEGMSNRASMKDFLRAIDSIFDAIRPLRPLFAWAKRIREMSDAIFPPASFLMDQAMEYLNGNGGDSKGLFDFFQAADRLIELALTDPPGTRAADLQPYDHNPTHASFEKFEIDVEQESLSQWTRATYPYVDSYRAPFRHFFDRSLPNSCLRTYFTHWTNRFTLIETHFRRRVDVFGNYVEDDSESEEPTDQNLVKQWREKLDELRLKLEALATVSEVEDDAASRTDVVDLLQEFNEAAIWMRTSGALAALESAGLKPRAWLEAVEKTSRNAADTARRAPYDPESELTEEEFRQSVETLAIYHSLTELLEGLSELDALVDFLDPTAPPKMYVLREMEPEWKGNEAWTQDPRAAEQMFTILVAARRQPQATGFGPGLFRNPNADGTIAFAQAMFYNANGREILAADDITRQVNTGWDTLNWQPPVQAPEWRRGQPAESNSGGSGGPFPWQWKPPLDVFTGRPVEPIAKVQLNWQSKLVPLTTSRLRDAEQQFSDAILKSAAEFLSKQPDSLLSH